MYLYGQSAICDCYFAWQEFTIGYIATNIKERFRLAQHLGFTKESSIASQSFCPSILAIDG
jgi:hypothetical protein